MKVFYYSLLALPDSQVNKWACLINSHSQLWLAGAVAGSNMLSLQQNLSLHPNKVL